MVSLNFTALELSLFSRKKQRSKKIKTPYNCIWDQILSGTPTLLSQSLEWYMHCVPSNLRARAEKIKKTSVQANSQGHVSYTLSRA